MLCEGVCSIFSIGTQSLLVRPICIPRAISENPRRRSTWIQLQSHEAIDREGICALPQRIPHLTHITTIACGERASAALTEGGALYTWGAGRGGRLGHGDEVDCPAPRRVEAFDPAASAFVCSIAVGEAHMAAVVVASAEDQGAGGAVFAWGNGTKGCLGIGGDAGAPRCSPLELDGVATQLCTSRRHMCALVMPRTTDDSW